MICESISPTPDEIPKMIQTKKRDWMQSENTNNWLKYFRFNEKLYLPLLKAQKIS